MLPHGFLPGYAQHGKDTRYPPPGVSCVGVTPILIRRPGL